MSSSISLNKRNGKSILHFYNQITIKTDYIDSYEDAKAAEKEANKLDIDFYSKHPTLLPKGVSVYKNNFRLIVKGKLVTSSKKNFYIGSAKTLKEIKEIKLNVIRCLFD
jgi:hypothetical protein